MNFQKIKDFVYQNIVYFAMYNVLILLVLFIIVNFSDFSTGFGAITTVDYFMFDYTKLSYFGTKLFRTDIDLLSSFSLFREIFIPVFYLMIIVAIVLYFISKKTEQRLLQFCMSIMFISNAIMALLLIFAIIGLFSTLGNRPLSEEISISGIFLTFFFTLFKILVTVSVCFIYLRESKKRVVLRTLPEEQLEVLFLKEGKVEIPYQRATRGTRFLNVFIDSVIIVLVFSPILMRELRIFSRYIEDVMGENLGLYVVSLVTGILYYTIFEGCFRMTPAKFLTSTIVTGYTSLKTNFGQIIGRSFCRKIPFEAFSFFGDMGWHDQLPETTVSRYETNKKYTSVITTVFIIAAIIILFVMLKNMFRF
ncbi:RDD family protein [Kordia periserrulae]|uniref:RDD family protein n=1 Tax=Kordia periserrulae TaxID=701523 RepID=A0A2T6C010_9FLAO|nr:RDD family protein [Kordia periserrulae]PTX61636.1 RDD family protein [Kordia periserrulae]